MRRVLTIIGLVALSMATGVAFASPAERIRLPVTVSPEDRSPAGPDTVVVVQGDHLWKISARHLGDGASDREVTPYWSEVVEVNTPNLRSGDPDLIYPGEIVELPQPPDDLNP